ncbi:MAG: type II toxin-antitoxin system HicA family toxin [Nitrospirae bacterium]|nr:type II toxin-antitoxin system HicA family toxin [Nitrospirota bacterium]
MLFTDIYTGRAIKAFGKFRFIVVSKGKHVGMSNRTYRVVVLNHKPLNPYTLRAIIKDAGIADNDFKMAL